MKKWINSEIEFLIKNYESLGGEYCATALSLNPKTIRKKAYRLGLKVCKERIKEIQRKNGSKEKPTMCGVDADLFINPQSKEVAYLLGFLWADGYLLNTKNNSHRISLEIRSDDFQQIKPIIQSTGKWSICHRTRKRRSPQSTAVISNKKLYNFLESHNYTDKSGCSASIIELIPDNLKSYWFRGFFDGDGWFYINSRLRMFQMGFAGPYDQDWNFLNKQLDCLSIKHNTKLYISKKGHKSSTVRSSSSADVIKFGNYIFETVDGLGLNRKYDKFCAIKNDALKIQGVDS